MYTVYKTHLFEVPEGDSTRVKIVRSEVKSFLRNKSAMEYLYDLQKRAKEKGMRVIQLDYASFQASKGSNVYVFEIRIPE